MDALHPAARCGQTSCSYPPPAQSRQLDHRFALCQVIGAQFTRSTPSFPRLSGAMNCSAYNLLCRLRIGKPARSKRAKQLITWAAQAQEAQAIAYPQTMDQGRSSKSEAVQQKEKIGVLLLNLGGPETLDDVQPFLFNLFNDDSIIRLPQQSKKFHFTTSGATLGLGFHLVSLPFPLSFLLFKWIVQA